MDDAFSFVWGHIKIGRSYIGGGRSEPEFPEKLIREVVNNALAHRDYTKNTFITIKINPGKNIEIKNPGTFKQKMIVTQSSNGIEIRRIIPGVPETKNPKLANVLKAFDKIESQGIGMATLVSVCLENQIDVPYYDLSIPDMVSLIIPSGNLIDEETQRWVNSFYGYINERLNGKMTKEHEIVLAYIMKSERLNEKRFYTILLSPSNNHSDVLLDLKKANLIIEHSTINSEQTPIYMVDRQLVINDFSEQIESQIGIKVKSFGEVNAKILNIIYRYNTYNKQSIKPSIITPELYSLIYGKEINPTTYESLGRRVRKICRDMQKANILEQEEDRSYRIKKRE